MKNLFYVLMGSGLFLCSGCGDSGCPENDKDVATTKSISITVPGETQYGPFQLERVSGESVEVLYSECSASGQSRLSFAPSYRISESYIGFEKWNRIMELMGQELVLDHVRIVSCSALDQPRTQVVSLTFTKSEFSDVTGTYISCPGPDHVYITYRAEYEPSEVFVTEEETEEVPAPVPASGSVSSSQNVEVI